MAFTSTSDLYNPVCPVYFGPRRIHCQDAVLTEVFCGELGLAAGDAIDLP